jgi:DNA-binding transcriptional regulator YiaG
MTRNKPATSWKSLQEAKLTPEAQARVRARTRRELEALTLKALRQDLELTQVEVSRAASMTQSELSRLESRTDHLTSTLRRYVEALGGELEVAAVFGQRRVKLTDA